MAEEEEDILPGAGPEASAEQADADAEIAGDSVAMSMALTGASRAELDAFLRDQRALITDQRHYLHERYKRLVEQVEETGLRLWELRLGILLRVSTLAIGLSVAAGIAFLVWEASHAKGLVIEPFAVPPELAAKGRSGQVVAAQILDRLSEMQEATDSSRPPESYANNWGEDIKVEIPETGISIGELRSFLIEILGHQTRISGEIYRSGAGWAVTARASEQPGSTVSGPEEALDELIQKAAEQVYAKTQPYRYANFLDRNPAPEGRAERFKQAHDIYQKLVDGRDVREQAWAWNGLGTQVSLLQGRNVDSLPYYRKAIEAWPDLVPGYLALALRENLADRREDALRDFRAGLRLLEKGGDAEGLRRALLAVRGGIVYLQGDYAESVRLHFEGATIPSKSASLTPHAFQFRTLISMARQHDRQALGRQLREPEWEWFSHFNPVGLEAEVLLVDQALENWPAIVALEKPAGKAVYYWAAQYPENAAALARAKAELGDFKGAETLIARTPGDCDGCVITRAWIAERRGEHARADWWFARAERQAPSTPFPETAWGEALLRRGQPDAAIAKFEIAHRKGPKFADPLELWGEALMAQNKSHLALAKFAEANQYAPNWARLHRKWGEALTYAGKKEEARKHFLLAAKLAA